MKYRTIEGGYKVPVFTKEWKVMWFMLGMFFQIFAPFYAVIYYAIRFPQIKTVREVAATWATRGLFTMVAILVCVGCILSLLS